MTSENTAIKVPGQIANGKPHLTVFKKTEPQANRLLLVVSVTAALVGLITYYMRNAIVDDSYIYAKVAGNILGGNGWSYNAKDFINACSGPLYAIMLLVPMMLGISAKASLLLTYALGLWASSVFLWMILRKRSLYLAAAGVLVLLSNTTLLKSFGMETSCGVAVLLAVAWLYETHPSRQVLLGTLIGLGHLIRPELALLLPLIVLLELGINRRLLWKACLASAGIFLIWTSFSYFYFGSVMSHSVKVKSIQGSIGWWAMQPAYYKDFLSKPTYPIVCFALAAVGFLSLALSISRNHVAAFILSFYAISLVCLYTLARAPLGYFWYNAPAMLGVNVALLFGLDLIFRRLPHKSAGVQAVFALALAGFATEFGMERLRIKPSDKGCSLTAAFPPPELDPSYRCGAEYLAAATYINQNTPSTVRVAMTEIGYLGFYSDRKVVDIHGLIHPEALEAMIQQKAGWWFTGPNYPEVIVAHEPSWPAEPGPNPQWWPPQLYPAFQENYVKKVQYGDVAVWFLKSAFA